MELLKEKETEKLYDKGYIHSGERSFNYFPGMPYTTFCGITKLVRSDVLKNPLNGYGHVTCPKCLEIIRDRGEN